MQLDEKGSKRSAGMKLGARLLEKREKRGTYDSIERGHICRVALCRTLHSSASSDLLDATSNPLRRKERAKWRSRSREETREWREREKEKPSSPFAASCQSYIVISSYLPNDKSARSLSAKYPLRFMRELIVDPMKKYRRYIGYTIIYHERGRRKRHATFALKQILNLTQRAASLKILLRSELQFNVN